ncbi:DUF5392 family protein [Halobacillus naozhouensis]|uniref:DUF5392 family protein n=1 Tax=Halobacillus naozhouensis TaxID=554880 RepID=A0ABY8IZF4_9BACI|nr:DUF5392 family protein [Halobacillus naozhouensis]WFT75629.1 DUF5392 family protein [Halobacillus naozhouensis]
MKLIKTDMPGFINREMEQLQKTVSPFMKKVSNYTLVSLPFIAISLINLVYLLVGAQGEVSLFTLGFYALLGAIGLALSKEAKFQKKEMAKRSRDYIIERIHKSEVMSEDSKKEYVSLIKGQPFHTMNYFIKFLEEENRESRIQAY